MRVEVPAAVLRAFGVTGVPKPLSGGQGLSWAVDELVLKPVTDPREAAWCAEVLATIPRDPAVRWADPVRSRSGRWVEDGWSAARMLADAVPAAPDWSLVLAAGRSFHHLLRGVPAPSWIGSQSHRWAVADRVAWGEAVVPLVPALQPWIGRLARARRRVDSAGAQLVHGDLSGNVLSAPGAAPAVIDFSPYWRPPLYAESVVVVDAWLWHHAPQALMDALPLVDDLPQWLLRALLFRLIALNEYTRQGAPRAAAEEAPLWRPIVERVLHLLGASP